MARVPALRAVPDADLFDDLSGGDEEQILNPLFDDESVFAEDIVGSRDGSAALDIEEVVSELGILIDEAVDFMNTELLPDWERAEEFYSGETDVPVVKGRSKATETVLRDAVRSVKPSVMRLFTQYKNLVVFQPADPLDFGLAAVAEQQTNYANLLFWNNDGYKSLLDITHNSLLKRSGILKTHRRKKVAEEFFNLENLSVEQLYELQQVPEVTIVEVKPVEEEGVTDLFHVELAYRTESAENRLESVDLTKFFVDDHATTPENARVIGEREEVTVGEALAMGLEYDDWNGLDSFDSGDDVAAEEERTRRGVNKDGDDDTVDPSGHKFLLTECYARYDLDGTGIPQLYRFFLGGTDYVYLGHDRVTENPYSVCNGDPLPDAFFGRSLMDVLDEDQNVQTSLIRAAVDNAHAANNKRLAVHDTLVNMGDVMNNAVGAPIRFRTPGMIQEIGVTSTLGTLLPLIQYLRQSSEMKAGVTNAAMGLDPDAMQSTDKAAVQNTIQLAQGQVELFCRNLAETGLRKALSKLLRLSMRHPPKNQPLPILYQLFDPDMSMQANIGLGTGNIEGRIAALGQIIQQQKEVIGQYGLANPICTVNHMLRAVVDMGTLMGLPNMGRYFETISPEAMQQLEQMMAEQAKANQPEPPSVGIAMAEQIRGQAAMARQQAENEQKTEDREANSLSNFAKLLLEDDYKRDALAQTLEIEQAKLTGGLIDKAAVLQEQAISRDYDFEKSLMQIHASNAGRMSQIKDAQAPARAQMPQPVQSPQQPQPQPGPQGMAPQGV